MPLARVFTGQSKPRKQSSRSLAQPKRRNLTISEAVLQRNAILKGLDAPQVADILKRGKIVYLKTRAVIYRAEEIIQEAFFPIDGVLSVVTQMKDGWSIEVGTIGREGVSAIPLLLGATTSANESYCQVPGYAVVITGDHFRELSSGNYVFQQLLARFLQAYVNMLGQLAACNGVHSIYERTARWLLMTHDRVGRDEVELTHEFLSMMLGARRSGVTIAAATLQQAGFIRYARGRIIILNRNGLEEAACECYQVAHEQFQGMLRALPADVTTEKRRRIKVEGFSHAL